jgi:hypothetical protein
LKLPAPLIFCLLAATSGCGPLIVVQHHDPSISTAHVWVDGDRVGEVEAGEELRYRVDRGAHRVSVTRPGRTENAWHEAGTPWIFIVDERLHLTLTTPTFRQAAATSGPTASDTDSKALDPQETP